MAPLRCPICRLLSPSGSARCDCGYRFKPSSTDGASTASAEPSLSHHERGIVEKRRSEARSLTGLGAFFIVASLAFAAMSYAARVPVVLWIGGLLLGGGLLVKASKIRPPR